MTRRVTDQMFKSLISQDDNVDVSSFNVVKAAPSSVDLIPGSRRLKWVISSEAVDRMGDVIKLSGWRLENYEKGGSVLWAHDPTILPVARPIKTYIEGAHLVSIAEYPICEVYEFGNTVYELAKNGFLRGASIGMRPIKYVNDVERKCDQYPFPMMFLEQELLEWSHTPIPANPEALQCAKSMGVNISPLKSWSEKVLDENLDVVGLSREVVMRAYHIVDNNKSVLQVPVQIESKDMDKGANMSTKVKAEPMAEPIMDHPMPENHDSEHCNMILSQILSMKDMFAHAAMSDQLDILKLTEVVEFLHTLQPQAEQAEEVSTANLGADETNEGFIKMDSFSWEDLTEQDIREVARDVISAELRKRKRP